MVSGYDDGEQEHPRLSTRLGKERQRALQQASPPLPTVVRVALGAAVLAFSIIAVTFLYPSPWRESGRHLFLRVPPPLSVLSGSVPAVQGCKDTSLTSLEARERAAIVLLLREQDLAELLPTLRNFEDKFNHVFRYPYVFFSSPDEPEFSAGFREKVRRTLPEGAVTEWGVVPQEHWSIPPWLDEEAVQKGFKQQEKDGVMYGGRAGYHHMCRWYSGLFARHPLLAKYDWYWRLEPGVRYFCSITYDPFRFLSQHQKVYGFTISVVETPNTIPTLFSAVQEYAQRRRISPAPALWNFLTKKGADGVEEYSLCHFWTNMEIGDLRFFRGVEYQSFFDHLDKSGGFFTERWGDAPIRSLGLGLLGDVDQIHFFDDFAYKHDYFLHCPKKGSGCKCDCPSFDKKNVDIDEDWWNSCLPRWKEAAAKGRHFGMPNAK